MKKPCEHYNSVPTGQVVDGWFIITHFRCDDCGVYFGRYVKDVGEV